MLSEDECSDTGGAEVESTGMIMASPPESAQVTRNDNPTPQETYHTPPEGSAPPSSASGEDTILHWGYKDSERAVGLGRDSDPGHPERTDRTASEVHGLGSRFEIEKARSLKRGHGSHETLSKKYRFSETNEGSRWLPTEGSKIMEINLRLETPDAHLCIVKEKIKENLEKAVESLKDYGSTLRREIKIREGTSTKRKLNLSIEIDGAPSITDLQEVSDSVPEPRDGPDSGKDGLGLKHDDRHNAKVIGTDLDQIDCRRELKSAANISGFQYGGGKDLPSCNRGKPIAVQETIDIRSVEQQKALACDDQQGESSTEINISGANVQKFKCDSGPKEADEDRRSVSNAALIRTVIAEMDCARGVEGVEDIEKIRGNKRKAIAESEGIGVRVEDKLRAQLNDDHEGQRSAVPNVQKDKDGSQNKEADRDYWRSVIDVDVIGIAGRDHRREVENVKNNEQFRYSREKDPCSLNNGKAAAGHKEIHLRGGERLRSHACDDHEGQESMEINYSIENVQNMCVNGNKFDKSSNAGGLRILPSCVNESVQHVPGRVTSKASYHPPKFKEIDIFDVLKQVAAACEGLDLERGSLLDFAKKQGITFPRLNS